MRRGSAAGRCRAARARRAGTRPARLRPSTERRRRERAGPFAVVEPAQTHGSLLAAVAAQRSAPISRDGRMPAVVIICVQARRAVAALRLILRPRGPGVKGVMRSTSETFRVPPGRSRFAVRASSRAEAITFPASANHRGDDVTRQSLAKAHQKIQELAWEPMYHEPYMKYGTDYTFRKAQKKDPLKQVLRSYFPMQEEKDHRVYGAQDGAIRGNMFRQVQERWLEWQKLFLSIIPLPEISAARSMPMLFHTVPEPGAAQRPGDPDDRRGAALDDPAEPQAPLHEQLHRPGRASTPASAASTTTTAARSAGSSRRASSPVTRSPPRAST